MLIEDDSLHLYHLTLTKPTAAIKSILGQFLDNKKSQELVLATSTSIELWQFHSESGKIKQICHQQVIGVIQNIDRIRKGGSNLDLLVITSDSGRLSILEFDKDELKFFPVVQEPHSKNGMNRTTPGEYLCVDPQDRTITIGAIERDKLMYKAQTNNNKLELSSPLESVSKNTLTIQMVSLDTGYENPMLAAIECNYAHYDASLKYDPQSSNLTLQYYEFEQGLNYVARRKDTLEIPSSSTTLVPLPTPIGGVIVAGSSFIFYHNPTIDQQLYLPIPSRAGSSPVPIVCYAVHKLKKNNFFILLHNELGDCFRVLIDYDDDSEKVTELSVGYFDTISPSTSINVFKKGYLFANVTNNDKMLYQIEDLGDNDSYISSSQFSSLEDVFDGNKKHEFKPRGLRNLALVQIIDSSNPCFGGALVKTSESKESRIAMITGHSHLKLKTHGIPISTLVSSPLPMIATSVFTTRLSAESKNDEYMVISSSASSKTLVLAIGEVVEEVQDSSFVTDQPTIGVQQVGLKSLIQIYSNGIRHIRQTETEGKITKKTFDWYPPAGITIISASTNQEQVLIGLSNRELCYFEIDPTDDQLIEYQERIEMSGGQICALALASSFVNKSQRKSPFALVACTDETVQVISLQQHNCLETLTFQALSANCTSAVIISNETSLVAHLGLENGLYVRSTLESITGKFSDTRVKYLGADSVKLSAISLRQSQQVGVLAVSTYPWLCYRSKNKTRITPLMGANIKCGTSFYSEEIGEGIVGASASELTIFTIGEDEDNSEMSIEDELAIEDIRLRYSPTKMILEDQTAFVIESEYGVVSPYQSGEEVDSDYYSAFGYSRKDESWASCVQILDLESKKITFSTELEDNQKPLSLCRMNFGNQKYLMVGTAKDLTFQLNNNPKYKIITFLINGSELELLHYTEVDHPPAAMIPFEGKLLVGMGKYLRLYELGKKQLLRKSSTLVDYLTKIVQITHQGKQRIVVGDGSNSTTFLKYDSSDNIFVSFADDVMKRHITALECLDHDTVIGGDKFGNVFVNRIPFTLSKQADQEWSLVKYQDHYLNSAGNRSKGLCEFFLQDIPTSFFKGTLVTGGKESIFYTGLCGSLGFFEPLISKSEVSFFTALENSIRKVLDPNLEEHDKKRLYCQLLGKDQLKFRGYYNPVKNVIDGDFVEYYFELDPRTKTKIATELDRTPRDIERKIADIRSRVAF